MKKALILLLTAGVLGGCGGKSEQQAKIEVCVAALEAVISSGSQDALNAQCHTLSQDDLQSAIKLANERNPKHQFTLNDSSKPAKPAKPLPPNLGRTYAQLMTGMEEYFPKMENSRLASGESRRMGNADQTKAMAIYEVVGEPGVPASRASVNFFAINDSAGKAQAMLLNLGNMTVTFTLVKNVFPDWLEGPKAVMDSLMALPKRKLKAGQPNESKIVRGDKTVQLSFLKELGMFTVAIVPTKD